MFLRKVDCPYLKQVKDQMEDKSFERLYNEIHELKEKIDKYDEDVNKLYKWIDVDILPMLNLICNSLNICKDKKDENYGKSVTLKIITEEIKDTLEHYKEKFDRQMEENNKLYGERMRQISDALSRSNNLFIEAKHVGRALQQAAVYIPVSWKEDDE